MGSSAAVQRASVRALIALAVVLVLAGVTLAGCGSKSSTATPASGSPSPSQTALTTDLSRFTEEDAEYSHGLGPIIQDLARVNRAFAQLPEGEWSKKDHTAFTTAVSTLRGLHARWQRIPPPGPLLEQVRTLHGKALQSYAAAGKHLLHAYEYGDEASIRNADRLMLAGETAWTQARQQFFTATTGMKADLATTYTEDEQAYLMEVVNSIVPLESVMHAAAQDGATKEQTGIAFAGLRLEYMKWKARTAPSARFENAHARLLEALETYSVAANHYFGDVDGVIDMQASKASLALANQQMADALAEMQFATSDGASGN